MRVSIKPRAVQTCIRTWFRWAFRRDDKESGDRQVNLLDMWPLGALCVSRRDRTSLATPLEGLSSNTNGPE